MNYTKIEDIITQLDIEIAKSKDKGESYENIERVREKYMSLKSAIEEKITRRSEIRKAIIPYICGILAVIFIPIAIWMTVNNNLFNVYASKSCSKISYSDSYYGSKSIKMYPGKAVVYLKVNRNNMLS